MMFLWNKLTTDGERKRQTEVILPVFVLSKYHHNQGSSCPFKPDG